MLSVQELHRFASNMTAEQFEKQLGPFVLARAAPDAARQQKARQLGAGGTIRLGNAPLPDRVTSLLMNLEHLVIATLPSVDEDGITVGRLPDCELVIEDESVSKHHARLSWASNMSAAVVEDLESMNGTKHNGTKVRGEVTLFNGDEIAFGAVRYSYLLTRTLYAHLRTGQFKP